MRYKVVIKYDGSKFCGFQRQNKDRSVQKEIENAIKKITKKDIEIKGAGRTDAGVHANYQVFHFDTSKKIDNLKSKLNSLLLPDIGVKKVKKVNENFHARHSVKKKEYIYKINLGPYQSSLNDYYFQPKIKLDIHLMKEASKLFLGTHDFQNFTAGEREDYHTIIYDITFVKIFNKLEIHFTGAGFFRYMVRNLVGALVEVGKCKISYKEIEEMLNNPNKKKSLPTAPAAGLYLNKVVY